MRLAATLCVLALAGAAFAQNAPDIASRTEKQAREALLSTRATGQVGGGFDLRVTSTDRSYNYKLRATWITPEVAASAARVLMLTRGLSESEALKISEMAAAPDSWLVLVELDPREGSGVIPRDWLAHFGLRDSEERKAAGQEIAQQGPWRTFLSAFPRDYSYDVFLMRFPRSTPEGGALLRAGDLETELQVRIYNKVGRVRWKIPAGLVP